MTEKIGRENKINEIIRAQFIKKENKIRHTNSINMSTDTSCRRDTLVGQSDDRKNEVITFILLLDYHQCLSLV